MEIKHFRTTKLSEKRGAASDNSLALSLYVWIWLTTTEVDSN